MPGAIGTPIKGGAPTTPGGTSDRGIDEINALAEMDKNGKVIATGEEQVEEFIPFRYPDLRQMLIKDHPDVFDVAGAKDDAERQRRKKNHDLFILMCNNMCLRNTLRCVHQGQCQCVSAV